MSEEPGIRLAPEELAQRAGVGREEVEELTSLGILVPEQGTYSVGDIRRVRMVHACDEAGMSSEAIAKAIAKGKLSLAFLDLEQFRWADRTQKTYRQLAAEAGLSVELLLGAHEALGVVRPNPEDAALDEDLEILPILTGAAAAGIPEEAAVRTLRVYAENLRRMAAAEADVYHDYVEMPLLRSGMSQREMIEASSHLGDRLVPALERAMMAVYRRQQEHAWTEDLVEHIEGALEEAGVRARPLRPPAMCFLDLSGYTELTEQQGDDAAAHLASTLAGMVQRTSRRHGGKAVKHLGDGVMFHFREPSRAVVASLEMVEITPQMGLPPAHVGVDAGPVVAQDGDYFGRTVNVAARVADRAGPGEVLVTDEVVRLCGSEDVRFHEREAVELKGVTQPVRLHEAVRA